MSETRDETTLSLRQQFDAIMAEMHERWDTDQDMRVGKMIIALRGRRRRYMHEIDDFLDALDRADLAGGNPASTEVSVTPSASAAPTSSLDPVTEDQIMSETLRHQIREAVVYRALSGAWMPSDLSDVAIDATLSAVEAEARRRAEELKLLDCDPYDRWEGYAAERLTEFADWCRQQREGT